MMPADAHYGVAKLLVDAGANVNIKVSFVCWLRAFDGCVV
jgi:hypothetical protein